MQAEFVSCTISRLKVLNNNVLKLTKGRSYLFQKCLHLLTYQGKAWPLISFSLRMFVNMFAKENLSPATLLHSRLNSRYGILSGILANTKYPVFVRMRTFFPFLW